MAIAMIVVLVALTRFQLLKLKVAIDRSTYSQASVRCSQYSPRPDRWLVAVMKDGVDASSRWYFLVNADVQMQFDIPLTFKVASKYKVSVKALAASDAASITSCYRVIGEGIAHFRTGACCYFYMDLTGDLA